MKKGTPTLLDLEGLISGKYSAVYFQRAADILAQDGKNPHVLMQIFQRNPAIVCGVDHVRELLKHCLTAEQKKEVVLKTLNDGDSVAPWETVMTLEGPYNYFAALESLYLGLLARATRAATNAREIREIVRPGIQLIFMADRYDHYAVQELDGHGVMVGGFDAVCTQSMAHIDQAPALGTISHSLIACYGGDCVEALKAFDRHMDPSVKRIALVDFTNDCVTDSLRSARALGKRLWGVRLDTAENMFDETIRKLVADGRITEEYQRHAGIGIGYGGTGVNPLLVWKVREALDAEGFQHVKIVVSGGFNVERVRIFEKYNVPVDVYGIGSSLYNGRFDYTADVVKVDAKPMAKAGRQYNHNPRLREVSLD